MRITTYEVTGCVWLYESHPEMCTELEHRCIEVGLYVHSLRQVWLVDQCMASGE